MNFILHAKENGFTLVELLVTIAIISMVSAVLFSGGHRFNDSLSASTAAESMSLAVRDVQSHGSSVSESGTGTGNFSNGYGIVFNGAHTNYAIEFIDKNNNKKYDGSVDCTVSGDECLKKIYIPDGVNISSLCLTSSDGFSNVCAPTAYAAQLVITFLRPNLDATIAMYDANGNPYWALPVSVITLTAPGGSSKVLTINTTGQVSIQ